MPSARRCTSRAVMLAGISSAKKGVVSGPTGQPPAGIPMMRPSAEKLAIIPCCCGLGPFVPGINRNAKDCSSGSAEVVASKCDFMHDQHQGGCHDFIRKILPVKAKSAFDSCASNPEAEPNYLGCQKARRVPRLKEG